MNIAKYLDDMKCIQDNFIEYLDNEENVEENLKKLEIKFEDMKIRYNKHDFRLFLHFISSICNNYYRCLFFFYKIEQILHLFKDDIIKYYSNSEIFNIFKENKRIILFLIKDEIIIIDKSIAIKITSQEFSEKYYPQYFAPELKPFSNERWFPKDKLNECIPDDFNEMRNKRENNKFICKLIREDLVEDFVIHINKNCISINATINPSIYETNSFLLEEQIQSKKNITLIEYAAFFRSIQIFTFLKNENANLPPSLWLYAIHGKNEELIHLLEELYIKPNEKKFYKKCLEESIKCHYDNIANYFINNYIQSEDENSKNTFTQSLKYYNFSFLKNEYLNEQSSFCFLCHYDYYSLAKNIFARKDVDINSKVIQNVIF